MLYNDWLILIQKGIFDIEICLKFLNEIFFDFKFLVMATSLENGNEYTFFVWLVSNSATYREKFTPKSIAKAVLTRSLFFWNFGKFKNVHNLFLSFCQSF